MRDFTGSRCELCGMIRKRIEFPKGTGLICVNQHCANSRIERRPSRRWIGWITMFCSVISIGFSVYNHYAHKRLDELRQSIIEKQEYQIADLNHAVLEAQGVNEMKNALLMRVGAENNLLRQFIESQGWAIDSVHVDYPDPRTFKQVDVI